MRYSNELDKEYIDSYLLYGDDKIKIMPVLNDLDSFEFIRIKIVNDDFNNGYYLLSLNIFDPIIPCDECDIIPGKYWELINSTINKLGGISYILDSMQQEYNKLIEMDNIYHQNSYVTKYDIKKKLGI